MKGGFTPWHVVQFTPVGDRLKKYDCYTLRTEFGSENSSNDYLVVEAVNIPPSRITREKRRTVDRASVNTQPINTETVSDVVGSRLLAKRGTRWEPRPAVRRRPLFRSPATKIAINKLPLLDREWRQAMHLQFSCDAIVCYMI